MSLYGLIKGYNDQEADTLDQKRKGLIVNEGEETQAQRRKDKADLEAANAYAAGQMAAQQGVMGGPAGVPMRNDAMAAAQGVAATGAAPGTTPATGAVDPAAPPMSATQGVMPTDPNAVPQQVIGGPPPIFPGAGRGMTPGPNPTDPKPKPSDVKIPPSPVADAVTPVLPKVTVTAKKDDDFNSQFAARREYLLKNGRADLAGKVDQEWNQHLGAALTREQMKLGDTLRPDQTALAKGDLKAKLLEQQGRVFGLALSGAGNPVTAPQSFKAINELNDQFGMWQTGQKLAGFQPVGKDIMFIDENGKPITDPSGSAMTLSRGEFEKYTGVTKDFKLEKLGPGDSLVGVNLKTGKASTLVEGSGEKPLTAEQKLVEQDKQAKIARDRVDEKLQRDNQTGQFLNSSDDVLIVSGRAKVRAAELVKQGVPGDKAGVQALDEEVAKFKRDASIAGKGGSDRLPKTPTGSASASPASATAKDYSKLW